MRRACSVLLVLVLPFSAVVAQRARRGEQTRFGAEEEIRRPVRVPPSVLLKLRRDERVEQCFQNDAELGSDISDWFTASVIDLNGDRQPDLVVKPEKPCLFGANIVPFWVFRKSGRDYRLILRTHSLGLSVLRSRTNRHRDIRVEAASAAMLFGADYKFDGARYAPSRCWEQSIEEADKPGGRVSYIPCSGDAEKPYRD